MRHFNRILSPLTDTRRYNRRTVLSLPVQHMGQRKLLMSEIEFLINHYDEWNDALTVLVYAGAAPGTHIVMLLRMFPRLHVVLVDPKMFHRSLVVHARVMVEQCMFTKEHAVRLRDRFGSKNILFISDIRTADHNIASTPAQYAEMIRQDNERQQQWILAMRPRASLVKFKLPWTHAYTTYLDGTIYLPVWGRKGTTESRLLVRDTGGFILREYDNTRYEQQMSFFNLEIRAHVFRHPFRGKGFYDGCYDCCSESNILQRYVRWKNPALPPDRVAKRVLRLCNMINRSLQCFIL